MVLKDRMVISLEELQKLTRRDFCRAAGVGLATLVLPACGGAGTGHYFPASEDAGTGDGGSSDDAGPADLGKNPYACPGGVTDTGMTPASFAKNTATFFTNDSIFVCRDASGLFGISSLCTHEGCDVTYRSSSTTFFCGCHGSIFRYTGEVSRGPAVSPLDHYALCVTDGGTIAYDTGNVVDRTARLAI